MVTEVFRERGMVRVVVSRDARIAFPADGRDLRYQIAAELGVLVIQAIEAGAQRVDVQVDKDAEIVEEVAGRRRQMQGEVQVIQGEGAP